jgi:hypothetical protein
MTQARYPVVDLRRTNTAVRQNTTGLRTSMALSVGSKRYSTAEALAMVRPPRGRARA